MSDTHASFIRQYEKFGHVIAPSKGNADRLPGIRAALEAAGVEF